MNTALLRLALVAALLMALPAAAITRYVDVNSTNPVPPYTNWSIAANVIQDAVDEAAAGDTVLVTNGVYDIGGKAVFGLMTNRVAVDKPLTLLSVNGPEVTSIYGHQVPGTIIGNGAVRCIYLTDGTSLVGFTLTNGATRSGGDFWNEQLGGGVWCMSTSAVSSNCVVTGCAAGYGGGANSGSFASCAFVSNVALPTVGNGTGGGAYGAILSRNDSVEHA